VKIFLRPGEIYVGDRPARVSTILGSCIAVTMFNERLERGAICHALLPRNPAADGQGILRYVDSSIRYMLERFRDMGVHKGELEVKLLGGADVIERVNDMALSVGQQNIQTALEIMKKEEIIPLSIDVGGAQGRKIHFETHTGKVLLERLRRIPRRGVP
jgi:chemotaxis protein CheD